MATTQELSTTLSEVRSFIVENFLYGRDSFHLSDDDSFLDRGVVDSTGMLELVSFLAERFGIEVADKEFVPENLDSIRNVVRFVEAKAGGVRSC